MKTAPSCLDKDVRPIRQSYLTGGGGRARRKAGLWSASGTAELAPTPGGRANGAGRRPQLRFPCLILAGEAVRPAGTVGRRPGPPGPAAP